MKFKNTSLLLLPVLLASCSPKVTTHLVKKFPVSVYPPQVAVYEPGESLPDSVVIVGSVTISDKGTARDCNYQAVVALAQIEASDAGGNALAIVDHIGPIPYVSSCHQITGNILYVGNSAPQQIPLRRTVSYIRQNTLYASVGYSMLTSDYHIPIGASGDPSEGVDIQFGFERVGRSGLGGGLMYSGYRSSYQSDINFITKIIIPDSLRLQMKSE